MRSGIYICTLLREDGDTGVQAHVRSLRNFFENHQVENDLITPYSWETFFFYPLFAFRSIVKNLNSEWGVWWYREVRLLALRWRLLWRLRSVRPSVVYCQCPVSAAAALDVRSGPVHRVVMIAHFNVSQADEWVGQGHIKDRGTLWHSIRQFEERVLPRLDAIIYVSRYMRDILTARMPALRLIENATIPNFVSLPVGAVRREAPGDQRAVQLVCVGTLEHRKNQGYALDVVGQAIRSGLNVSISIVGDGPDRALLEERAAQLGIRQYVKFLGRVKHAAALMGGFDALIHVARMESFGIVLIEAMAHGLPVFAAPVGGVPDVFCDGVEGRFLPLDDVAAASAVLSKALSDGAGYQQMSEAAASRAQRDYGQESVGQRLLAFLCGGVPLSP